MPKYQGIMPSPEQVAAKLIALETLPTVATVAALPPAAANAGKTVYVTDQKQSYISDGTAWEALARITIDQSAGRVVKVWDYLNQREQMVYGDTGLRNITSLCVGLTSGTVHIQRTGATVIMRLDSVKVSDQAGAYSMIIIPSGGIPSGFRTPFTDWYSVPADEGTITPAEQRRLAVASNGTLYIYNSPKTADSLTFTAVWPTSDPWPASLPGVAVGSIPS